MFQEVRVRFAPSPTGPLHIGGVRTALFNYLFAKKNGGTFYVRIEDTDQKRYVEGSEQYIMEALEWLGIFPDETINHNEKFGPYRQSERKDLYKKYADQLIESGNAYYAFDTSEALDEARKSTEANGGNFIYNHTVREKLDTSLLLSSEEIKNRIDSGEDYVIRFKTPTDKIIELTDLIRGSIKFDTNLLDDKVLFKSDGMPTYHLANIVDDHLMLTSHVIRGEEWLPSMPLHVMLYEAFGWDCPEFAHLPLILKPVGNGKLSKRDGDKLGFPVFPLEWITEEGISSGYREKGFFPETVINFLALLGWNDGTDKELYTLEELVESFDLARVNKAGAKFDPEKNKWFNHQYLITKDNEELAKAFAPILYEKNVDVDYTTLVRIVGLIKERANFVSEFWELGDFFFQAPTEYDAKALKNWKEETPELMRKIIDVLKNIDVFKAENIELTINDAIEDILSSGEMLNINGNQLYLNQKYILQPSKLNIASFGKIEEYSLQHNSTGTRFDTGFYPQSSIFDKLSKNESESLSALYNEKVKIPLEDDLSIDLNEEFFTKFTYEIENNKSFDTSNSYERFELYIMLLYDQLETNNKFHPEKFFTLKKIVPIGKIMQPLRLSLVGALKGPHLFEIIELIGKDETIKRIEKAIEILN